MKKIFCIAVMLVAWGLTQSGNTQIAITNLGQVYNQNFDSLGTNHVAWTNEVTIPGWLYVRSTNGVDAGAVTNLIASDGSGFIPLTPFLLNLGAIAATDRALGSASEFSQNSGFIDEFFYGARFINNTGNSITNVNVNYFGEQWRDSFAGPLALRFFHRVGSTGFLGDTNNVGWTATPSLDFISLQNTGSGNILGGNISTNRTNLAGDIPVTIAPGQEFWIRWMDLNNLAGDNHFLGIDDVSITFNGLVNTNNNPSDDVLKVELELKKPNPAQILKFGQNGFKVKAWFRSTNTLNKASFVAFTDSGTNTPTNVIFTDFDLFKILTQGRLFNKNKVNALAKTRKNKAGAGNIPAGSSPVTLIIKVDGVQGNNSVSVFFTNIFTDVKVK